MLTPLFKGLDVPIKVPRYKGRTFTDARGQFWPRALRVTINDYMDTTSSMRPDSFLDFGAL